MKKLNLILFAASIMLMVSCGADDETGVTYEELIDQGWSFFENAEYDSALFRFTGARDLDPVSAEAYTGRGWCFMKQDQLPGAASEFSTGNESQDPKVELYAGWAFTLNALKNYSQSNTQASRVLLMEPDWIFSHGLNLNADHLHLLKAENYFALGDYVNCLTEVKVLNISFNADVSNSDGQSALAAEIERLKTTP